jgi:hypothetical protein
MLAHIAESKNQVYPLNYLVKQLFCNTKDNYLLKIHADLTFVKSIHERVLNKTEICLFSPYPRVI